MSKTESSPEESTPRNSVTIVGSAEYMNMLAAAHQHATGGKVSLEDWCRGVLAQATVQVLQKRQELTMQKALGNG